MTNTATVHWDCTTAAADRQWAYDNLGARGYSHSELADMTDDEITSIVETYRD